MAKITVETDSGLFFPTITATEHDTLEEAKEKVEDEIKCGNSATIYVDGEEID